MPPFRIQSFQAMFAFAASALVVFGCKSEPDSVAMDNSAPQEAWFAEVSSQAGLNFTHVNATEQRYYFPEIMSGGGGWFDFDNDGFLDIYLVQGGALDANAADRPGNRLYRNQGDGTFLDVTAKSGVGDTSYGMGCAIGDIDNDGDLDLYVTNVGTNKLYRNNGDGTFTDITARSKTGHDGWGASAAFVDYDNDGFLDLFVVNYVNWTADSEIQCFSGGSNRDYCHPSNYNAPAYDVLYHNNGDGTFRDVSKSAGITKARANGLGIAHGDFNNDGFQDFYVANDGDPNQLWLNNGDGTFSDHGLMSGSAVNRQGMAEAGMGVIAVDIENDGDLDLFISHLRDETNTLYINNNGLFEDNTNRVGLSGPSISYTGFGLGFADFNADGELDLYVANGRVGMAQKALAENPYAEPNQLFEGTSAGHFKERPAFGSATAPLIENSRAAAFGDYDNDGDIDILVVNNGQPVRLLQNTMKSGNNWLAFQVQLENGREAIGARVGVRIGNRWQWRQVQSAYSYQSANDARVHFGLGQASQAEEVRVIWTDGAIERFDAFPANAYYTLKQTHGRATNG